MRRKRRCARVSTRVGSTVVLFKKRKERARVASVIPAAVDGHGARAREAGFRRGATPQVFSLLVAGQAGGPGPGSSLVALWSCSKASAQM